MEPIDVVMLTKNSEHMLVKSLRSIYENVPVKRLIVIDGFSTDNTLKIMDGFNKKYGNVKIIFEKSTRAKARERGIEEVTTPWFMFVDSDVVLCEGWFEKAQRYIDNDVGAIWGLNIDVIPNVKNKLFLKSLLLIARECFNLRGGMHDTLIRHELVKDIRIPERLHAYEDAYIVNWIKKKGYKAIVGDDIYCLHFRPSGDWALKQSISLAVLEMKCGLVYLHVPKYTFFYPFFILYWFLQVLNKNSGTSPRRAGQR